MSQYSKPHKNCPLCAQPLPFKEFKLYPKSAAVMHNGYVTLLGPMPYGIIAALWKAYPAPVEAEILAAKVYKGTHSARHGVNSLITTICNMRRDHLTTIGVRIKTHNRTAYALVLK